MLLYYIDLYINSVFSTLMNSSYTNISEHNMYLPYKKTLGFRQLKQSRSHGFNPTIKKTPRYAKNRIK